MRINNKIYILLSIILVGSIVIIFAFFYKTNNISPEKIQHDLYTLDPSITVEQVKEKGFIDVSGIQKKENIKITEFLADIKINKKSILKVFEIKNNKMYLRILYNDPEEKEIRLWTYLPWEGISIDPDKRFSTTCPIIKQNNITTIQLINVKNESLPLDEQILANEPLYSYYSE